MKQSHLLLLIAAVLCGGYALWQGIDVRAQTETVASLDVPSPTPTATFPASDGGAVPLDSPLPTPTPTATPPSPVAEAALRAVAEREEIPAEELTVGSEQPVSFELLERSYTYVTVHHDHPAGFRLFAVLVDPATLAVEPDYNAVRDAEEAAYHARYGRLHPSLHERLQEVGDEELLPVAMWVAQGGAERSQEEIEAEVVARYPAAGEARAEDGVLWAVADPDLAREIQLTYERLLFESVAVRVQPLAEWLKEQGFAVGQIAGMPALSATLPKRTIVALNERDDVAQIFLTEGKAVPEATIAIATDRVSHVWARGYTGAGSRIAILERSNTNATAGACLNIVATRASIPDPDGHKSVVAAVAACNNITNSPGVAPGAQILDAGHAGTEEDAIEAIKWATNPSAATPAHVVNHSEGIGSDNLLQFTDRAYDYWIKARGFTAVKSAGNNAGNVTSPGKAYNIITVGNVNDQNTASWSDDDMWWESSYFNPNTGVEKPEVVAPGTTIETVAGTWTGTSFSAPQVAGLAALLMQRHSDLKNFPTAVKAIVMATAVHNIEGSARLSHIDGAGAIDVALADWVAQIRGTTGTCVVPCWWNIATTDSFPSNGGNVERTFNANRGERIRVVIAWLSYADPPTANSLDELRRNFDLNVITPNGETKISNSTVNNFEIVDFTAPATGQYTIRVIRNSSGDKGNEPGGNQLGIAWVKLGTYLPEVRRNNDGWTSTIYVRNDGRTDWQGKVSFYHQTGAYASEASITLAPNTVWRGATPPNNWIGTAIVEGSDDISVVIRNDKTGLATLDNGFSAGGATDPAWGQAGTALYAPALYNNIFGGYNSTFYAQNANADSANLILPLLGRAGHGDYTGAAFMGPGNQQVLPVGPIVSNNSWVGSLHGNAGRPMALRIFESKGSGESRSYNASTNGRWLVYVPVAYKNIWGFITGLVIQNLHASSSTNVTLRYCERTVTNPATCPTQTVTVPARRSVGINLNDVASLPNGWTGSVSLQSSSSSFPLAVAVTNARSDGGYSVSGTGYGSKLVILPRAARNANNRTTGYTVRNVSGLNNVSVTARYYRASDGNLTWTRPPFTLHSAQSDGYFQTNDGVPDGWEGSIVLEATADIVAVMREDGTATTSAYNGVSR